MRNLRLLLLASLLAALLLPTIGLVIWVSQGNALLNVQTNSMAGSFEAGDGLLVKRVPLRTLKIGDIVSYRTPRNPNVVVTHRLIALTDVAAITQGDRLEQPDPAFPTQLLIGQAVAVLPELGTVLGLLQRPIGLAAVLYAPASWLIIYELRRVAAYFRRPTYILLGHARCRRRRINAMMNA